MLIRSAIAALLLLAVVVATGPQHALPTSAGSAALVHGDLDCDGGLSSRDNQALLREVLNQAPLSQTQPCTPIGDTIALAGYGDRTWGDVDCDGEISSRDNQGELRAVLQQAALSQTEPCPDIGAEISVGEPGPTSDELIAAALEAGDIDDEQALLYRIFAGFGDSRLPAEYQGDDSAVIDNGAIGDLPGVWDSLSQETKDILEPFLKLPYEEGSWETLPTIEGGSSPANPSAVGDWTAINAANPVRVWYKTNTPGDAAVAQAWANAIDNTIWAKVTGLLRTPKPDCGPCTGGGADTKTDIWVVDASVRSYAIWVPSNQPRCSDTGAAIVMSRAASLAILAHEFAHVAQYAYTYVDCVESSWWWEATAMWMIDAVYPQGAPGGPAQEEQYTSAWFLDNPRMSLDTKNDKHEYGSYLLPFYVAEGRGSTTFVKESFQNMAGTSDPLAAISDALDPLGGFDEVWPEFTLENWNREPVTDYEDWDDLFYAVKYPDAEEVHVEVKPVTLGTPYLAADYKRYVFNDDAVRSVVFDNRIARDDIPHAAVWAITKIDGDWKAPEDLTEEPQRTWCRDTPDEHIEELVLIFSNMAWETKDPLNPPSPVKVIGKDLGCEAWEGTASATIHVVHNDYDVTYTSGQVFLHFEPQEVQSDPENIEYDLTRGGPVNWVASGMAGDCTVEGQSTVGFPGIPYDPLTLDPAGYLNIVGPGDFHSLVVRAYGAAHTTITCPGDPPIVGEGTFEAVYLALIIMQANTHDPNGLRLRGSQDVDSLEGYSQHFEWSLHPAPRDEQAP